MAMSENFTSDLVMSFKSPAAIKTACLLLKTPDGFLPVTPGILSRLINCSYRAIKTGLKEMAESGLVAVKRDGDRVSLTLLNAPRNRVISTDNATNVADTAKYAAPSAAYVAVSADREEEEDLIKKSSSSLKSAQTAENFTETAEIPAVNAKTAVERAVSAVGGKTIPAMIDHTLDELGMRRKFVFQKVLRAAQGLPPEKVREALEKCLLYNAQTPGYVLKVLHQARADLAAEAESARDDTVKRQREIELGELLLAGRKVRFEQLSQSQHLRQFAHDLYDPLGKCCVLTDEYRGEVEKTVRKLESVKVKAGGGGGTAICERRFENGEVKAKAKAKVRDAG